MPSLTFTIFVQGILLMFPPTLPSPFEVMNKLHTRNVAAICEWIPLGHLFSWADFVHGFKTGQTLEEIALLAKELKVE